MENLMNSGREMQEPSRIGGSRPRNYEDRAPATETGAQSARMPQPRNALEPGYAGVAKALHWVIVGLLIVQYAVAWTMPGLHRGTRPEGLISVHLSLGLLILVLVGLHIVAALYHHFWRRDRVLKRMLPGVG